MLYPAHKVLASHRLRLCLVLRLLVLRLGLVLRLNLGLGLDRLGLLVLWLNWTLRRLLDRLVLGLG
jgi:hypothetical protein